MDTPSALAAGELPHPPGTLHIRIDLVLDVEDILSMHRFHEDSMHLQQMAERDRLDALPEDDAELLKRISLIFEVWDAAHEEPLRRLAHGRAIWTVIRPDSGVQ